MSKKLLSTAVIAGALALSTSAMAGNHDKMGGAKPRMVKCAGEFVTPGKNDCAPIGGGTHTCSGQSKERTTNEWMYTPKGMCDRLGGKVVVADDAVTDPNNELKK